MGINAVVATREPGRSGSGANKDWLRALQRTARIEDDPGRILAVEFDSIAATCGEAPALISDRESFTFSELAQRSNQYARWAVAQNLRKGDCVCLLMGNRAEYVAVWLGLNRVGVAVALLDTSLLDKSLAGCIAASRARHVIVAEEFRAGCVSAPHTGTSIAGIFVHGVGEHDLPRIDLEIARLSSAPLAEEKSARSAYLTMPSISTPPAQPVCRRRRSLRIAA